MHIFKENKAFNILISSSWLLSVLWFTYCLYLLRLSFNNMFVRLRTFHQAAIILLLCNCITHLLLLNIYIFKLSHRVTHFLVILYMLYLNLLFYSYPPSPHTNLGHFCPQYLPFPFCVMSVWSSGSSLSQNVLSDITVSWPILSLQHEYA